MSESTDLIEVAVGVLTHEENVLLCRRAANARYALQWEFPGGKIERGESPSEALCREIREELGVEAAIGEILWQEKSEYPDGGFFAVSFFHVPSWKGEIVNYVFDKLEWTSPLELVMRYDILQGNRVFCEKLPEILSRMQIRPT